MSKVVLFQGDSITDASRNREVSTSLGIGYANYVAGELGMDAPYQYKFFNRGISGNRIVDLYARIKADMINLKPDYMSILVGVNDVWHEYSYQNGVSAEKFEMVYDLLVQELRQQLPNTKIMILEPFVLPGSKTENSEEHPGRYDYFRSEVLLRAEAAKRIADKYNLSFVPLQGIFDKANADAPCAGYWLMDGVHPTPAGHALIKRAWLEVFKNI